MINKNLNVGLLILRLSVGILMLFHGVHKLIHGINGIKLMLAEQGLPEFLAYGVHTGETIAPIMIILGFRTRLASIAIMVVMLVALTMVHSADIFTLQKSGAWANELLGLYLFGGLALFFTGAGKYALSTKSKWD